MTPQNLTEARRYDMAERVQSILSTSNASDQAAVLFVLLRGVVDLDIASMLDDLEGIYNTRGYSGMTEDFLGHAEYLSKSANKMLRESEDV